MAALTLRYLHLSPSELAIQYVRCGIYSVDNRVRVQHPACKVPEPVFLTAAAVTQRNAEPWASNDGLCRSLEALEVYLADQQIRTLYPAHAVRKDLSHYTYLEVRLTPMEAIKYSHLIPEACAGRDVKWRPVRGPLNFIHHIDPQNFEILLWNLALPLNPPSVSAPASAAAIAS
jgi:hypothetical protein